VNLRKDHYWSSIIVLLRSDLNTQNFA